MISEDGQGVGRESSRRYVDDAGEKLAGDLIHIRDHEEQALGRRVGRRQRACLQGAVYGAGRAALGLHLNDADLLPENVLQSVSGPRIRDLRHNGRGSDGIDCGNFRERVRNVRGSVVAVHGYHFSCHV